MQQGIDNVKFTNEKGLELPNVNWIAGVSFDPNWNQNDNGDNEDNEEDQDHAPDQQTGNVGDTLHCDDDAEEDELEDPQQDQEQDSNPTESDEQQVEQMEEDEDIDNLIEEVLEGETENNQEPEDGQDQATEAVQVEDAEDEEQEQEPQDQAPRRSTRPRVAVKHTALDASGSIKQQEISNHQKMQDIKIEQQHNISGDHVNGHQHTSCEATVVARATNEIDHRITNGEQHMQQQSFEKGVKKYGNKGKEAAVKEVAQPTTRSWFKPTLLKNLCRKERKRAQRALMHLAQKRDKTIKGRMACNG